MAGPLLIALGQVSVHAVAASDLWLLRVAGPRSEGRALNVTGRAYAARRRAEGNINAHLGGWQNGRGASKMHSR